MGLTESSALPEAGQRPAQQNSLQAFEVSRWLQVISGQAQSAPLSPSTTIKEKTHPGIRQAAGSLFSSVFSTEFTNTISSLKKSQYN